MASGGVVGQRNAMGNRLAGESRLLGVHVQNSPHLSCLQKIGGDAGARLRGAATRVIWQYQGDAGKVEHALNTSRGQENVLQAAPPFATSHLLAIYHHEQIRHFKITFDDAEHHVQARRPGEVVHVLGKSALRRLH